MTSIGQLLLQRVARLLEREEREAVLGDLMEAGESAARGLIEILGLLIRKQAALWQDWRPWLAAFGVALPGTLLLMGVSLSVSCTYQRLAEHKVFPACAPTGQEGVRLLLCHILLLLTWSWTGGFVIGSVSRRTLWVSAGLSLCACCYCLVRFPEDPLSALSLFLFVPMGLLGVRHALRMQRVPSRVALAIATSVTVLMILAWSNGALWIRNWALLLPAWYIAIGAMRSARSI